MSEYTFSIRYKLDDGHKSKRTIPFRWHPSGSDMFDAIRRLRAQYPGVEVLSATLYQTVLIERIEIPCEN